MLSNVRLKESEVYQKSFVEAWNVLKKYSVDSVLCVELVKLILNSKESCPVKNFGRDEISFLYSQAYDFDCLKNVPEFHKASLQVSSNYFYF